MCNAQRTDDPRREGYLHRTVSGAAGLPTGSAGHLAMGFLRDGLCVVFLSLRGTITKRLYHMERAEDKIRQDKDRGASFEQTFAKWLHILFKYGMIMKRKR